MEKYKWDQVLWLLHKLDHNSVIHLTSYRIPLLSVRWLEFDRKMKEFCACSNSNYRETKALRNSHEHAYIHAHTHTHEQNQKIKRKFE